MPTLRTLQRTFIGGALSPSMEGHMDDPRYRNGTREQENMLSLPQGSARKRPGFALVSEAGGDADRVFRSIPFKFSDDQAYVIEAGSRVLETGTAVSVDDTGLSVTGTPWSSNEFRWYYVECGGAYAFINSSSTSSLTVGRWYPEAPNAGETFYIYQGYFRFHTQGATLLTPAADAYVPNLTFTNSGITTGSPGSITFGSPHGLADNQPIEFTIDSGSTSAFTVGVVYYAEVVSTTVIRLRDEPDGSALTIASAGSGTFRMHAYYEKGDLVTYGGSTWYCNAHPISGGVSLVPGTAPIFWFEEPADGAYEIPTPYGDVTLPKVKFAQKNDVLTLTQTQAGTLDLAREGATRWTITLRFMGADIDVPAAPTASTTFFGEGITIASVSSSSGALFSTAPVAHQFSAGDPVYTRSLASYSDGFAVVERVSDTTFYLQSPVTGVRRIYTAATGGGTLHFTPMSSQVLNSYVITAVQPDGQETEASDELADVDNCLLTPGAYNTITWSAVDGAERYRVYKKINGLYGLIGETEGLSFTDDNIKPDLNYTPPRLDEALNNGDWPAAVGYFQVRRMFGGTPDYPQKMWGTRVGSDNDLSYSIPVVDDDRLAFELATNQRVAIRHIVPVQQLIVLTDSVEFRITGTNSDALTPASIHVRPQSYVGASHVTPLVVNNLVLFCAARGGHLRELGFSSDVEGYLTGDLSLRAAHFFDSYSIVGATYSKAPYPLVWTVSSSGAIHALTYIPEERVMAWHKHTTDGDFLDACSIPDGDEDRLYALVRRNINGTTRVFMERMGALNWGGNLDDAFFVDCGLTLTSNSSGVVSGLDHLIGESVVALADGVRQAAQTVSATGTITVSVRSATQVHVGLPYDTTLTPMPFAADIEALAQGRTKNLNMVYLRVLNSAAFNITVGSTTVPGRVPEDYSLASGVIDIMPPGDWNFDGVVTVSQSEPLPLEVVSLTLAVSVG